MARCEFHWGSEHTVAGAQMAMEAQCVHTLVGSEDRHGILSVLWEIGEAENAFLGHFEDVLPGRDWNSAFAGRVPVTTTSELVGAVNFNFLLAGSVINVQLCL